MSEMPFSVCEVISELTGEDVAVGVGQVVAGIGEVRPLRPLRRGRNHVSWVMSSSRGLLVCKVLVGVGTALVERLAEHHRLCEHHAPIVPLVAFAESCPAVGRLPLVVLDYLEGIDAEEAAPSLDPAVMVEVMRSTGAAVARLHRVPVEGFGDAVTGLGAGPRTWPEVVEQRIRHLLATTTMDSGSTALLRSASDVVCEVAAELTMVRPAATHLDVFLPNILVDSEGRFLRLLDLEHLRWVDPVMDFVKPAMWMFEQRPSWAHAFAEGYAAVAGWPDTWEQRMSVATGLELISGVDYWARVNARDMFDDYSRRLHGWVSSGGSEHAWSRIQRE
ncbi:aminoglycoside phosphotransferase family protein [Nocardia sp. NPDC052112]|uniref:aminoglycoside phosphotransferase family protein n=1 Tax=Nocardia sp. NPDC052112 TaxID=3155646 RepID=UPI0034209D06